MDKKISKLFKTNPVSYTLMKVNINDKDGKTYSKKLDDSEQDFFTGKKIGEEINGEGIGLTGYKLKITGGSDKQGFPMRKTLSGTGRKKLLTRPGVGFKSKIKGIRKKKSIRGNEIAKDISQINLKVLKSSNQPLSKILQSKEEKQE